MQGFYAMMFLVGVVVVGLFLIASVAITIIVWRDRKKGPPSDSGSPE